MLDILSNFLVNNTSVEQKIQLEHAHLVLDQIGLDDYEYLFEDIMGCVDNVDAFTTMDQIVDLTRTLLFQVLSQHAVTPSADVNLDMLANLAKAMLDLDDYENRQELLAICNSSANVMERFCELVALVTVYKPEDLMPIIEDVSDMFMVKVKSQQDAIENDDEDIAMLQRELIHQFKLYFIYCEHLGGIPHLEMFLTAGGSVGAPYVFYLNVLRDNLVGGAPEAIARELYGCAIVSSDDVTPLELIRSHMEEFFDDTEVISAIMANVNKLIMGHQK